jgi:hypothetical protein
MHRCDRCSHLTATIIATATSGALIGVNLSTMREVTRLAGTFQAILGSIWARQIGSTCWVAEGSAYSHLPTKARGRTFSTRSTRTSPGASFTT